MLQKCVKNLLQKKWNVNVKTQKNKTKKKNKKRKQLNQRKQAAPAAET